MIYALSRVPSSLTHISTSTIPVRPKLRAIGGYPGSTSLIILGRALSEVESACAISNSDTIRRSSAPNSLGAYDPTPCVALRWPLKLNRIKNNENNIGISFLFLSPFFPATLYSSLSGDSVHPEGGCHPPGKILISLLEISPGFNHEKERQGEKIVFLKQIDLYQGTFSSAVLYCSCRDNHIFGREGGIR